MDSAIQTIVKMLMVPKTIRNATLARGPNSATAMGRARKAWGSPKAIVTKEAIQKGGRDSTFWILAAAIQDNLSLGETWEAKATAMGFW
jgi:hypothetical protein